MDWLFATGTTSLLPNNLIDKGHYLKSSDPNIADALGASLTPYDNHYTGGDPRNRTYFPDEFLGSKPYPTVIQVTENPEFIDPETGQITAFVPVDAPEGETQIGTTSCTYIIDYDTGVALTNDLAGMGYNWLTEQSWNPACGTIAVYSLLNQGWLFTSQQEGARDTIITLLSVEPTFLERLNAVIAAGNRMYLKQLALSKKYGVYTGLRHVLSKQPIDAASNLFLAKNSPYWYHYMGALPTAEQICWLLMSNGLEPMGLVSPGNPDIISTTTPDWITGRTKTSQVGLSQSFHDHWNWATAAAFGVYRMLSAERIPELSDDIAPGVLVAPDGSTYPDPDPTHVRGTLFGALLRSAQYTDPTGNVQYAYPQLVNDSDWNDVEAAINAGKCTLTQAWYLVNDGFLIDPVARTLIRDSPDATAIAALSKEPNGPLIIELAQMKEPA